MSLLRQSAWAAGASVLLTGSRFALAAVLARRLSQAGYGQFAYAQWLVDVSFLVCSLGSTGVVSRYVAEFSSDPALLAAFMRRWRRTAYALPLVAGLGVAVGLHLSRTRLGPLQTFALVAWGVSNGLWALQTAALVGLQRFDRVMLANSIAAALMLTGVAVLPLSPDDPAVPFAIMALASAAGALVGFGGTLGVVKGRVEELSRERRRDIRSYAANVWLTSLLWSLVWSRGEFPLVRHNVGDSGLAQYAAALTLMGGAVQGVMLAVSAVASQLTRLWGQGLQKEALDTARTVMDLQLLVSGAAAVTLTCFAPELLGLAFGAEYRGAAGALGVLGAGLLALALSSHNHILQIATNARFSRDTSLAGLVVLFAAAAFLTSSHGLLGAALARGGTMLVLGVVSLVAVRRRWGTSAVSTRGFLTVLALVAGNLFAVRQPMAERLGPRAALFVLSLLALAFLIRDRRGATQVATVVRAARDRVVRRAERRAA